MKHYTHKGFRTYMLSEAGDVVVAADHQHLAVKCDADVGVPGPELEVGALHPGSWLLLQVYPPAVPQDGEVPVVACATVDEEAALFLPCLYRGHRGMGSANRGVLR